MHFLVTWRRQAIIVLLVAVACGGPRKLGPAGLMKRPGLWTMLGGTGLGKRPRPIGGTFVGRLGPEGSHETAEEVGISKLAEQEGAEEDALAIQEQDAAILAAEANRTLAEARAAIQKVRASRGYYPLGGKGDGKKGAKRGKPKGRPTGKSWGKGGEKSSKGSGCLICGSSGHFFRDCPRRFKAGGKTGGFKRKGKSSYWAEPVYAIYHLTGDFIEPGPLGVDGSRGLDEFEACDSPRDRRDLWHDSPGRHVPDWLPRTTCTRLALRHSPE